MRAPSGVAEVAAGTIGEDGVQVSPLTMALIAGQVASGTRHAPSLIAGWITGNELFSGVARPPAVFIWHRAAAFTTSGVALLVLLWRALARDRLAGGAGVRSVAATLVAAAVVGYTGYLGGVMNLGSQTPAGPAGAGRS